MHARAPALKLSTGHGERGVQSAADDTLALLTSRYKAAYNEYQAIMEMNNELALMGAKRAPQDVIDEERAFDRLDAARYALLNAAAQGYPTIH